MLQLLISGLSWRMCRYKKVYEHLKLISKENDVDPYYPLVILLQMGIQKCFLTDFVLNIMTHTFSMSIFRIFHGF